MQQYVEGVAGARVADAEDERRGARARRRAGRERLGERVGDGRDARGLAPDLSLIHI